MEAVKTSESLTVFSSKSAPNSPRRLALSSAIYFYSTPASPISGLTSNPFVWETEAIELTGSTGIFLSSDDFEFETSQQFESPLHHQQLQHGEDPLAMSYADELFCNGQVLPLQLPPLPPADKIFCSEQVLPLKLSPLPQDVNKGKCINRSSSAPLRSPGQVQKGLSSCWSFRKKDFDPSMAALKHVRKEEEGRNASSAHRRTTSLPVQLRSSGSTGGVQHLNKEKGHQQPMQHVIPRVPTEAKRLVAARPEGRSRTSHENRIKPSLTTLSGSIEKTGKSLNKSATTRGGSHLKGTTKQKIKDFLFRSASEGRTDKKDKLRDHTAAMKNSQYSRSYSFKSFHAAHYNAKKGVSGMLKKTIIPYKPCLFVCLGSGPESLRNID